MPGPRGIPAEPAFPGYRTGSSDETFHHTKDPIYQRLIVAILKGYYVPPLRVAAVADAGDGRRSEEGGRLDAD